MSEELMIKNVEFLGDSFVMAQDKDNVIWTSITWFCNDIGLTKEQTHTERRRVKRDMLLNQGSKYHRIGTGKGNQDVLCLRLDYVPLWIANIPITSGMKRNYPESVEKLMDYKMRVKNTFANSFDMIDPKNYN